MQIRISLSTRDKQNALLPYLLQTTAQAYVHTYGAKPRQALLSYLIDFPPSVSVRMQGCPEAVK